MSVIIKLNFAKDIHFVTTNTHNRWPIFKNLGICQILIDNLKFYQEKYQLKYYGYVIVPDHVHLLINFDLNKFPDLTISKIMHDIKGRAAQQISKYILLHSSSLGFNAQTEGKGMKAFDPQDDINNPSNLGFNAQTEGKGIKAFASRNNINTRDCLQIWQPSFWDYNIYSEDHFKEKLDYIHRHPIKHKLTENLDDYKYCSWINNQLDDHSVIQICKDFYA